MRLAATLSRVSARSEAGGVFEFRIPDSKVKNKLDRACRDPGPAPSAANLENRLSAPESILRQLAAEGAGPGSRQPGPGAAFGPAPR